jgi:hypothetical protein
VEMSATNFLIVARNPRGQPIDECGCRLGSHVALLVLISYFGMTIALPLLRGTAITFSCWQALAALFGGALVGKTVGLLRARR